ncbi:oxalate:formate antiporter [Ferrimonas marina]|uniref:Streptomycin adenylyltransferase n=1 Tax=Ferrimonas marina TaxID=299255 RepID=A0A1M5ZQA6_9GAMM|nr:oxalate:formate antiporter [Ferrimonas marina]SHI26309.1 hypothetical protein SAMN02745129_0474 [Ferrimonas marina]
MHFPTTLPAPHRTFLQQLLTQLTLDNDIVGLAAAGSFSDNSMDAYSDLDLVVAVEPEAFDRLMPQRQQRIQQWLPQQQLLSSFTGEHVGEPRLLIALYDDGSGSLLHVDFKFVRVADAQVRVDDPTILWARDERLAQALSQGEGRYPQPDPQWIEDRFWIWLHYGAGKIARGELFEALDFLSFLRLQVLGPLALAQAGHPPAGVRKLERLLPAFAQQLQATVAQYDADSLWQATAATAGLYLQLRPASVQVREQAQSAAMAYLAAHQH